MKQAPLIVALSLAAFGATYAEEDPGRDRRPKPPTFEEMDANGDGSVSLGEFTEAHQKELERRFRAMDTNNDGKLSQGELEAARERMRQRFRDRE